jgi:hypothetical protein
MPDFFSTPDDTGEIRQSELQSSLGERLGAQARDSLTSLDLFHQARLENAGGTNIGVPGAGGELDVFSGQPLEQRQAASEAFRAAVPDTAMADAKARVKQEGLDGHLKLPDQDSIKSPVLDLMIQHAHDQRDREMAIARGPQGFTAGALGLVTSLGVGMIDPLNLAAFSVPVLGEARWGKLLANAGDSLAARAGVRALQGGALGAAGTTLLQPVDWWLHTQDGQDYTMADALKSVVMGAGMGAAFHAGGGAIGDLVRNARGLPLKGSPEDLVMQGLMGGRHIPAEALTGEGVPADELAASPGQAAEPLAGLANPDLPIMPAHPAEVLADLPPAAREDVFKATVADIAADRPSRGAEVLQIAADHDPRIAESIDLQASPERVIGAAYKIGDRVFQAPIHALAVEDAMNALGAKREIDLIDRQSGSNLSERMEAHNRLQGFVTSTGRFVDRKEAEAIAQNADQLKPGRGGRLGGLNAEDMGGDTGAAATREIDQITAKNGEPVKLPERAPPTVSRAAPDIPDLVTAPKRRGRAAANPDTLSLNELLASKGGLKPDPELEAIYGNKRGPFVPGFGPLVRKTGMALDEALSLAKQHGYMFDPHDIENGTAGAGGRTSHGLTPNDLLDHLDAENRGQKLYKPTHVEKTKYDPEQEKHVIMGALEHELEAAGEDVSKIDPKLLNRTVEIVHREGVSDVLDAYERAIMEDAERYNAVADAAQSDPRLAGLPGLDDGRAAPGDGGRDRAGGGQAGRADQGRGGPNDPQSQSHGARAASAAVDPRWRELADAPPAHSTPEAISESQAADAVAEPASVTPKALSAVEQAAKEAEEAWRKVEGSYSEAERAMVNDALAKLDADRKAKEELITEGAACLAAAEVA